MHKNQTRTLSQLVNPPFILFEVANVHGGSREQLLRLVGGYENIQYQPKGIKFQAFKADRIALPDFSWYRTYEELFFGPELWKEAIHIAAKSGEVWLDIFDTYGIQILSENQDFVAGIKLQASVLDNAEVFTSLSQVNITHLKLMINVAGYELSKVGDYVRQFRTLKPQALILQVGFQAYPTEPVDTGLQKIPVLRAAFPDIHICFADHAPAGSEFATEVPALAVVAGCSYIEKHFCLGRNGLKYDYQAALDLGEVEKMLVSVRNAALASQGLFVNRTEADYLRKSYQAPVASRRLPAGSLVSKADCLFRRTGQAGLTWTAIGEKQAENCVLGFEIANGASLSNGSFRKARIGVIVACRMKSSRLLAKATIHIHGVSSVERCLQNCLRMEKAELVVLATSTLEEDAVLSRHTLGGSVKFWQGDPDDVINRYLGACSEFGIDVVVRVTADCPVVSPEITAFLLAEHFKSGADYTAARTCAVGSSGEIYNTEALRRVIARLGKAEHSEYMTWYLRNNPDVFKVNLVDLPSELVRDYRLTLDYPEDLEMFNQLFARLEQRKLEPLLPNIFEVLDENPEIPAINGHLTLKYQTDQALIEKLNRLTRISPASVCS